MEILGVRLLLVLCSNQDILLVCSYLVLLRHEVSVDCREVPCVMGTEVRRHVPLSLLIDIENLPHGGSFSELWSSLTVISPSGSLIYREMAAALLRFLRLIFYQGT